MRSPEDKRRNIRERLLPGAIVHYYCEFTNPAKHKFIVIGRAQSPTLVFLINSAINPWLQARPHLRDCQVGICQCDHDDFLTHDSFLDCTQVEQRVSLEQLEQTMMDDVTSFKGWLTAHEREAVLYAVESLPNTVASGESLAGRGTVASRVGRDGSTLPLAVTGLIHASRGINATPCLLSRRNNCRVAQAYRFGIGSRATPVSQEMLFEVWVVDGDLCLMKFYADHVPIAETNWSWRGPLQPIYWHNE
ncbi:MAG: hypothetical protein ABI955_02145 [Nitrospirota bacterium]